MAEGSSKGFGNESELPFYIPDLSIKQDTALLAIPVDAFIEKFGVTNQEVKDTLHAFPTLSYLLGNVTDEPQSEDPRPDGVLRPVHFLTKGSGMFDLQNKEDAMRWRGIFNHIMGTARQVYFLSTALAESTPKQRQQFRQRGYDIGSFEEIDPQLLTSFMFISHSARRQVDERAWHNLSDKAHPPGDSGEATIALLKLYNAPQVLLDLMRVELHTHHLVEAGKHGILTRMDDNILTYCDWTFSQQPDTLKDRYEGLRKSKRQSEEVLDVLEGIGTNFENALKDIIGKEVVEAIPQARYEWEEKIRRTYCTPSGITLSEAFPKYTESFGIAA